MCTQQVQLMRLTEVIKTEHTDPAVFALAMDWSNSLGKTSVACGDTPGFIVNRLLVPSLAQAILLVDRGDASVADVDVSMQLGAGEKIRAAESACFSCGHTSTIRLSPPSVPPPSFLRPAAAVS